MNLTLVTITKFSETMLWVVGFLFVANLAVIILILARTGNVDQDEGQVVTEQGSGGNVLGVGMYVAKEKILLDRSTFISDESLLDGTATGKAMTRPGGGLETAKLQSLYLRTDES